MKTQFHYRIGTGFYIEKFIIQMTFKLEKYKVKMRT